LSPAYAIALKGANDASYPNQITILISNASDYCSLLQTTGSREALDPIAAAPGISVAEAGQPARCSETSRGTHFRQRRAWRP
jgi:hypothetical protein